MGIVVLKEKRHENHVKILGVGEYESGDQAAQVYKQIMESLGSSDIAVEKNLSAVDAGDVAINIQGTIGDEDAYKSFLDKIRSL